MIASRYLTALLAGVVMWCAVFLAFTWTIDPYGVSPMRVTLERINVFKPKRLDIDRLIKPYEVWRYQPRTVFLGTSRIHQSIDPSVLDGTRFAPAYNASIPASSLSLNIDHLRQYVELDPGLRTVILELFIYNFLGQGQNREPKGLIDYIRNTATLFVSADVLFDSFATLTHNLFIRAPTYEIKPGGFFYYPPGHDARGPFAGFPAGIWAMHPKDTEGLKLHDPAFETIKEIIDFARAHNLELIFVATPNHAYVDYYIDRVGSWDLVREWLTRLSKMATVYSFSQPNDWVYEPVTKDMTYWNDPFHFSLAMGGAISASVAEVERPDLPSNFMVRMTPELVPGHVEARRRAVRDWARKNPDFIARFAAEQEKHENGEAVVPH